MVMPLHSIWLVAAICGRSSGKTGFICRFEKKITQCVPCAVWCESQLCSCSRDTIEYQNDVQNYPQKGFGNEMAAIASTQAASFLRAKGISITSFLVRAAERPPGRIVSWPTNESIA